MDAASSCGQTEVLTAKFCDAAQTADIESREDESTTVLNETFLQANHSALTSDEMSQEVDMQGKPHI